MTEKDMFWQLAYDAGARGEELEGLSEAMREDHIRRWREREESESKGGNEQ